MGALTPTNQEEKHTGLVLTWLPQHTHNNFPLVPSQPQGFFITAATYCSGSGKDLTGTVLVESPSFSFTYSD